MFLCIKHGSIGAKCSQVDPIVASFSGGAVGVISALMVVEINNVKQQEHKRCKYCLGTGIFMKLSLFFFFAALLYSRYCTLSTLTVNAGYLACARCSTTGSLVLIEPVSTVNGGDRPLQAPKTERCSNCSGSGKVWHPKICSFNDLLFTCAYQLGNFNEWKNIFMQLLHANRLFQS